MKLQFLRRVFCAALAFVLVLALMPAQARAAATYTLDIGSVADVAQGTKNDGDTLKCGTDNYFTIFFSAKARLELNSKSFSDGFAATKRLNFGASTKFDGPITNAVQIKTSGAAEVTVWWVSGGDGREVAVYTEDGTIVTQSSVGSVKNDLYISTLSVSEAGTYYIGNVDGNNNYYKLEVVEQSGGSVKPPRGAWADVAAPVITAAADNGSGTVSVTVSANVSYDGGDEVIVTMYDASGKEIDRRNSVLEKGEHTLYFSPDASGKYTFQAVLRREGEKDKPSAQGKTADFVLPLANPTLISATSKGGGKISLVWSAVKEAEKYEVYCNGTLSATVTGTQHTLSGLTVGQKYTFKVIAVRGSTRVSSSELSATATAEEKVVWGFTHYGPSTNADNNGYVGDVNETGSVTVFSEGGKGKIQPNSVDGLAFYYTAVPVKYNFTLRAKVTVDSWTFSNGQEGFGLMVADRLGESGNTSNFWNNQYMALATKIEYRYDEATDKVYDLNGIGTKYTMKLGLGTIAKTGVTRQNLALLEANDTETINTQYVTRMTTLESAAGFWGKEAGTYNVIGNYAGAVTGSIENALLTEFILEIQKNNTGYFITYYGKDGNVLAQQKYYGADSLNVLDSEYVYAGFFASRNARATFSDVEFTTILASEDAPAEEKPVNKVEPVVSITSATVATSLDYVLMINSNVDGTVKISVAGQVVVDGETVTANVRYRKLLNLSRYGDNRIQVEFTPDPDQYLGEDTVLSSTDKVYLDITVTASKGNYHRKTIYVSPDGLPNGNGTREHPFDIYTAVNSAVAGQTIVLMEGTYKLSSTVRIQRGMDGTETDPIRMIADPGAATRPVLDFQKMCAGIVHGGNYWYFAGFDVTNSQDGQKGFQVSGSYNVLDQIEAYRNGNTGIQISRYAGSDLFPDWPAYNLILNCTSYYNADPGFEDADGFAAKLTCGEGNVFDGCVAYNNADDGWDLYAKVETGSIGAVTIRNCVAYNNGFMPGSDKTGNGNGFKMGGDSLSGCHVLENSYAFFNLSKGIDSNSCPDIIVKNCVSYNNGRYNVAFYTNNAGNTNFIAGGIVSFKDATSPHKDAMEGDNLKPRGSQDVSKFQGSSNYYWTGSACVNASGKTVTADMFVSLEFKGIVRKADGTIDMQGFLALGDKAPGGTGVKVGSGTPSRDMTSLPEDLAHSYSSEWTNTDSMYHWHECECGDRGDLAEHTFQWVIDREVTETTTGLKHEECTVCGYKKPAIEVYPENPNPTEPSQAPEPTQPGNTEPAPQEGSFPWAIVVIAVVAVAAGGFCLYWFVLKKKKS